MSIATGPEVCEVIEPLLSLPAVELVSVVTPVHRKQYSVLVEVRSLLGKVTSCPLAAEAVVMPGQADDPEGMSVVDTVQFEAVELTVNPVGKVTFTDASVPVVIEEGVLAQTKPVVAVEAFMRSKRTYAS